MYKALQAFDSITFRDTLEQAGAISPPVIKPGTASQWIQRYNIPGPRATSLGRGKGRDESVYPRFMINVFADAQKKRPKGEMTLSQSLNDAFHHHVSRALESLDKEISAIHEIDGFVRRIEKIKNLAMFVSFAAIENEENNHDTILKTLEEIRCEQNVLRSQIPCRIKKTVDAKTVSEDNRNKIDYLEQKVLPVLNWLLASGCLNEFETAQSVDNNRDIEEFLTLRERLLSL